MKFIATGGFGEVYSAFDGLLKQKNKHPSFAIKLIKKYRPLDQRVNTKVLSKRLQVGFNNLHAWEPFYIFLRLKWIFNHGLDTGILCDYTTVFKMKTF